MAGHDKSANWQRGLAALLSVETDPERLVLLVQELRHVLDEKNQKKKDLPDPENLQH
jgi:hypothetical protein